MSAQTLSSKDATAPSKRKKRSAVNSSDTEAIRKPKKRSKRNDGNAAPASKADAAHKTSGDSLRSCASQPVPSYKSQEARKVLKPTTTHASQPAGQEGKKSSASLPISSDKPDKSRKKSKPTNAHKPQLKEQDGKKSLAPPPVSSDKPQESHKKSKSAATNEPHLTEQDRKGTTKESSQAKGLDLPEVISAGKSKGLMPVGDGSAAKPQTTPRVESVGRQKDATPEQSSPPKAKKPKKKSKEKPATPALSRGQHDSSGGDDIDPSIFPLVDEEDGNTNKVSLKRTQAANLPPPVRDGPSSGSFRDNEKEICDQVFAWFLNHNPEYNDNSLRRLIADWRNAGEFKDSIAKVLPNRTRDSLRKFCHRRYSLYIKGPWTPEMDEQLKKNFALYPNSWAKIAEVVERDPQSCRDRWRHISGKGENAETGPWSVDEENELLEAVDDTLKKVRSEAGARNKDLEKSIDWKTVSAKMNGKRNAKHCRDKYVLLKKVHSQSGLSVSEPTTPVVPSKKQRPLTAILPSLQLGDIFDILTEIHTAVDSNKTYRNESTVWSIVSQRTSQSRFDSRLRRRVFYEELEKSQDKLPRSIKTIPGKAMLLASLIELESQEQGLEAEQLPRGYSKGSESKSASRVVDSEDEDECNLDAASKGGNAPKNDGALHAALSKQKSAAPMPQTHKVSQIHSATSSDESSSSDESDSSASSSKSELNPSESGAVKLSTIQRKEASMSSNTSTTSSKGSTSEDTNGSQADSVKTTSEASTSKGSGLSQVKQEDYSSDSSSSSSSSSTRDVARARIGEDKSTSWAKSSDESSSDTSSSDGSSDSSSDDDSDSSDD
ncbi:hypothetical protein K470DRAFT_18470 [Piedraia hortae CBS 480.64]|uniref:Uncharacterized protein n=1 Tax=Piedraia hortae CBS 480.64 TaxID=1314780 RepID=A0A6A7C4G6_9PEZI|nr:hypothetical protein K470DRAFT_18470 [Piedraia hortae CBS 480.64]